MYVSVPGVKSIQVEARKAFWNAAQRIITKVTNRPYALSDTATETEQEQNRKRAEEFSKNLCRAIKNELGVEITVEVQIEKKTYRPPFAVSWLLTFAGDSPEGHKWGVSRSPSSNITIKDLYDPCLNFVKKMNHASCFEIMKEFHISYSDSVHLMDILDEHNIVDIDVAAGGGPLPLKNGNMKQPKLPLSKNNHPL